MIFNVLLSSGSIKKVNFCMFFRFFSEYLFRLLYIRVKEVSNMHQRIKKVIVLFFAFILTLSLGVSVLADDDEHEKREHGKNSEYYEKTDDEEYENEYYNSQGSSINTVVQDDYWYLWSRMPINNPNKTLPITAPSDLSVSVNGNTTKLYFIPQEGQLFVSGEKLANILGAQAQYYPQSKILRITQGQYELIVRADSNAVYENRVKNPMPVKTASYEKTIYLPISVAANALGYRINWDAGSNTIMIESI
jgi:hypothetical protein